MHRLAVITSQAFSMHNFRGPLISALRERGVEVYAFAPDYDASTRAAVTELGATPIDYALERAGRNPARDAVHFVGLTKLLKQVKPDATLSYFIKPVIYGSLAAAAARVPRRFSIIEGLGYVFARGPERPRLRRVVLRASVCQVYRAALALNEKVFFLNPDDLAEFEDERLVDPRRAVLLDGIGVDLKHYGYATPHVSPVTFLLAARLLAEKGVREYAQAARLVREKHPGVRFLLAGGIDLNPHSLREGEVQQWVAEGILEWTGHVADIRALMHQASVFVLPSYYREGLPRSTQEALAMGRPIITTDTSGCRQTVERERNGYLVPVRDARSLAEAMLRFVEHPESIEIMGRESRRIAEQYFDVHKTNDVILRAMGL